LFSTYLITYLFTYLFSSLIDLSIDSYKKLEDFSYDFLEKKSRKTDLLPVQNIAHFKLSPVIDSYLNSSKDSLPTSSECSIPSAEDVIPRIVKLPSTSILSKLNLLHHYEKYEFYNINWSKLSKDLSSKLVPLLKMIQEQRIDVSKNDFVCMRRDLQALMSTPYFGQERKWRIGASKLQNTIFLSCFFDTKKKEREFMRPDDKQRLDYCQYYLKHCLTVLSDDKIRDNNQNFKYPSQPENILMGIFRTDIRKLEKDVCDSIKLLYSGDLDALSEQNIDREFSLESSEPKDFEMIRATKSRKSYEVSDKEQQHYNYLDQNEIFDWWTTGTLSGISKIHLAKLDEEYRVHKYHQLNVNSIPRLTESSDNSWSDLKRLDVMATDYLYMILEHIKKSMKKETNPRAVYMFENHRKNVHCYKINEDFQESRILPDWFIENHRNDAEQEIVTFDDFLDRF